MNFLDVATALVDAVASGPECYRLGLAGFGDPRDWADRVALEVVLNAQHNEMPVMAICCDSLSGLNVAVLTSRRLVVLRADTTVLHDVELVCVGKVELGPGVIRIAADPRDIQLATRDDFHIHNFARELQRLAS